MTPDLEAIVARHADCDAYCLVSIGHEGEALICDAKVLADALTAAEARISILEQSVEAYRQALHDRMRTPEGDHETAVNKWLAAEADADALAEALRPFVASDAIIDSCDDDEVIEAGCLRPAFVRVRAALAAHDARRQGANGDNPPPVTER